MRNIILAVTAFTLAIPARAVAQGTLWVTPGAKIRVTAPTLGLSEQVGRVRETRGDTLVLLTDVMRGGHLRTDTVHLAMPMVTKLDVRTGGRSHWLEGAGIGFALGAVIGVASGDDPSSQLLAANAGQKAIGIGSLLGIVGAVVGKGIKSDRWSEVPLDQIRPRLVAQQDGVGVGVSIALRF